MTENIDILLQDTAFLYATCTGFASVIRRSRNQYNNVLYPLESRLASRILFAQQDGCWKEKLTEVAELMGVSYRHLLRTLQSMCQKKLLEKRRTGYQITDFDAMRELDKGYYPVVEKAVKKISQKNKNF